MATDFTEFPAPHYAFWNKTWLKESKLVGCLHCVRTFSPDQVAKYVDQQRTALCPFCHLDTVVPEFFVADLEALCAQAYGINQLNRALEERKEKAA